MALINKVPELLFFLLITFNALTECNAIGAYDVPISLKNLDADNISDNALVHITVHVPNINFTLTEVGENPYTLAKTFEIHNYGDTLTDLMVYADDAIKSNVTFNPVINHGKLDSGASVTFEVIPTLYANFTDISGFVYAKDPETVVSVEYGGSVPVGTSGTYFLRCWANDTTGNLAFLDDSNFTVVTSTTTTTTSTTSSTTTTTIPSTCYDGVKNNGETGVDCGTVCNKTCCSYSTTCGGGLCCKKVSHSTGVCCSQGQSCNVIVDNPYCS
jgi:hypothetical protein